MRISWMPPSAVVAFLVGSALALSRLAMTPALRDQSPFFMAAPSMIVAAYLGGLWPTLGVGAVALWVGETVMTSSGGAGLRPFGLLFYLAFALVFAAAGEARKRGLRRARADAARLAEMQLRLARVARLNAMGEIAGTLAHELNQPLTAIASYAGAAEFIAAEPGKGAQVVDLLRKVSEQTLRAREIVGRIRNQVSGGELELTPQSLSGMFEEALAATTAGGGATPTIQRSFDPAADHVLADRVQIEQVIVNLLRNALEAMRTSPVRRLAIGARTADDGKVEAWVADSGEGLAPEVADRLFEPFATSKPEGTGIGLAISRSIVEAHGGRIWAEAAAGDRGAVFRFTLKFAGTPA